MANEWLMSGWCNCSLNESAHTPMRPNLRRSLSQPCSGSRVKASNMCVPAIKTKQYKYVVAHIASRPPPNYIHESRDHCSGTPNFKHGVDMVCAAVCFLRSMVCAAVCFLRSCSGVVHDVGSLCVCRCLWMLSH